MAHSEDKAKTIKETVNIIQANCWMQVNGIDVAYPYMYGAPGGGKTASLEALCRTNNWGMKSTHFALKHPEELGGIPQFKETMMNGEKKIGTVWSVPDLVAELHEMAPKYSGENQLLMWLMDDVHLMDAHHNSYMYELLTNRTLRGCKIPDNVAMVFAGNHGDSKAGAKNMFGAVTNRMAMMPVYASFKDWKSDYAIPNHLHLGVVSFLENDQYTGFFHEDECVQDPWGSPRSWARFANMLSTMESWYKKNMSSDMITYLAAAHIGARGAGEFYQYYNVYSKFNLPDILANAEKYKLPDNPLERYALAFALISYYFGHSKEDKNLPKQFAMVLHKFIKNYADLGLMAIHEIINMEKILGDLTHYGKISAELNKIEPGITRKLLGDASAVISK